MKRKHFSREQQQELLSQWRSSGLSGERFAEQHSISSGTLWRWKKLWEEPQLPGMFRAITVQAAENLSPTSPSRDMPVAELVVGGLTARVYAGIRRQDLAALVAAFQEVAAC